MKRMIAFLAGLGSIDRRWVFLGLAVAVSIPFFAPPMMRAVPSGETKTFHANLNRAIESDKPLLFSINFGPQTVAEMEPIAKAVMHQIFSARKPVVFLTFLPESAALMRTYLEEMEALYDLKYGEDYVFLGYASAYWIAIYGMGTSMDEYFHEDDRGTPLGEIPLMTGRRRYEDFAAVIDIASNTMPRFWITYGVAPFGFDFLMGCTAVQATDYFPYLQTGQVKGLLAGGRSAAEMESILESSGVIDQLGDGSLALGAQSLALLTIIAFILAGNLGFLFERKKGGRP